MNVNTRQAYILGAIAALLKAKSRTIAVQAIVDDCVSLMQSDAKAGLVCWHSLRKAIREQDRPFVDRSALKRAGLVFLSGRYVASASFDFGAAPTFRWDGPDPERMAAEKAAKAAKSAEKAAEKAAAAEAEKIRKASLDHVQILSEKLDAAIARRNAQNAARLPGALLGFQSKETNKKRYEKTATVAKVFLARRRASQEAYLQAAKEAVSALSAETLPQFAAWFDAYRKPAKKPAGKAKKAA